MECPLDQFLSSAVIPLKSPLPEVCSFCIINVFVSRKAQLSIRLNNASLTFPIGGITVGSSRIIQADLSATNGVVHVIDKVILPEPQPNIVKVLTSDKRFSTLATAATVAGLISTLESGKIIFFSLKFRSKLKFYFILAGPFTLFAPTDDAFRALPAGALDNLIANPEELKKILLSHVVSGKVLSTDLSTGDVPFVSGASTRAVVSPSK